MYKSEFVELNLKWIVTLDLNFLLLNLKFEYEIPTPDSYKIEFETLHTNSSQVQFDLIQ